MAAIKYDNQGDALSRDVPREALALIDAGGNGSERRYSYDDIFRLSGAVARGLLKRGLQRGGQRLPELRRPAVRLPARRETARRARPPR